MKDWFGDLGWETANLKLYRNFSSAWVIIYCMSIFLSVPTFAGEIGKY